MPAASHLTLSLDAETAPEIQHGPYQHGLFILINIPQPLSAKEENKVHTLCVYLPNHGRRH